MRLDDLHPPEDQSLANSYKYKAKFLDCFPTDSDPTTYVRAWLQRFFEDRAPDYDFSDTSASVAWLEKKFAWSGWELNNLPLRKVRAVVEKASYSEMCFFNEELLEEMIEFIILGRGVSPWVLLVSYFYQISQ